MTYTASNNVATHTIVGGSSLGCDSIVALGLTINNVGIPGIIPDSIIVCESFNIEIEMTALNMHGYQWQLNNGTGFLNLLDVGIYTGTQTSKLVISPLNTSLTGNFYSVIMNDGCGNTFVAESYIAVYEPHDILNPMGDITRCLSDSSLIFVDYNGYNYQWSNGQIGQYLTVDGSGIYSVSLIESGTNCVLEGEFEIVIEDCVANCVTKLPTGFTPGTTIDNNDVFRVMTSCEGYEFYEIIIVNKWGEIIFQSNDYNEGWDGTYKNIPQEMGVYVYYVNYIKNGKIEKENLIGNLTLLR